jgi:hypothetical protein
VGTAAYPVNVIGAQVSGIAAACAHMRRITADEALARIRKTLGPLKEPERRMALVYAAAGYLRARRHDWWYPDAAAIVEQAGADMAAARALADHPRRFDLSTLGEQDI